MRYALLLHFIGENYHGWQVQTRAVSVQGELEKKLYLLNSEQPVRIHGCGRTDTGVHASFFVAHVELNQKVNCKTFMFKLNNMLPNDIAVHQVIPVTQTFHSRFSAISRSYTYYISKTKNAYLQPITAYYNQNFDVDKMNAACEELLRYSDFASFCKAGAQNKTTLCTVEHAKWHQSNDLLVFEICADRFLRNMVRAIVGTLLEVGLGKLSLKQFKEVIEARDRRVAGFSVPGRGLHLSYVEYPAAHLTSFKPLTNPIPDA